MSGDLDRLKDEYGGTLAGKLFVVGVLGGGLVGVGAGGILGGILATELLGWETPAGRTVGVVVGATTAVVLTWVTGVAPWRLWEYW